MMIITINPVVIISVKEDDNAASIGVAPFFVRDAILIVDGGGYLFELDC